MSEAAVEARYGRGGSARTAKTRHPRGPMAGERMTPIEEGAYKRAIRAQQAPAAKSIKPIRANVTDVPSRPSPALRRAMPTQQIHRGNYQAIILAEFVAAILLTAATPIASSKSKSGLSPYVASDMVQLGALTLLYFILALISVGGGTGARLSAWFGGLILIGVGLGEAASIAKTLDLFGTSAPSASTPANTGVAEGSAGPLLPQINPTVGGIS